MSYAPSIAMIGECMIELNGLPFTRLQQQWGGDTINTAVYFSRLSPNYNVYYVTAMGTDQVSQTIITEWQQERIQQDFVLRFPDKHPGLYWISVDAYGERSFLYWRNQSAASQWLLHHDVEHILQQLLTVEYLYLSGISLAILSTIQRQKLLQWLAIYQQQGGKIIFDSNYRPQLWKNITETQQAYTEIMPLAHILLLTMDDEMHLWQQPSNAILQLYQTTKNKIIVLKTGSEGAFLRQDTNWQHIPTQAVLNPVDTTAAGDSFNAAFLAAFLQQHSLEQACHWGNQLAHVVIQHQGAIVPHDVMPIFS